MKQYINICIYYFLSSSEWKEKESIPLYCPTFLINLNFYLKRIENQESIKEKLSHI